MALIPHNADVQCVFLGQERLASTSDVKFEAVSDAFTGVDYKLSKNDFSFV